MGARGAATACGMDDLPDWNRVGSRFQSGKRRLFSSYKRASSKLLSSFYGMEEPCSQPRLQPGYQATVHHIGEAASGRLCRWPSCHSKVGCCRASNGANRWWLAQAPDPETLGERGTASLRGVTASAARPRLNCVSTFLPEPFGPL